MVKWYLGNIYKFILYSISYMRYTSKESEENWADLEQKVDP